LPDGDIHRGAEAVRRFRCGCCHVVREFLARGDKLARPWRASVGRGYIAGVLPTRGITGHTRIPDLRGVDLLRAMPDLGVSDSEARDIATYLCTLRSRPVSTGTRA